MTEQEGRDVLRVGHFLQCSAVAYTLASAIQCSFNMPITCCSRMDALWPSDLFGYL